jgi:hypothetical protein
MIDGEDRLEILEQDALHELLEERLQATAHRLRFHDGLADAFEIGEDRAQALGELVGLPARLAHGERRLAQPAIGHPRIELLDRFEVEADLDDQSAEALRHVLVQARQPLADQERPHRHVDCDAQPVFLLLEPS